ncbi:MAG: cob(I)yrinic acid a,c-diamide adenosyltransferase [Candidatus Omnitrophica bacterium]|nr:cob(I)yrinic acid a,c-diamide adenosyltransferase [Candidatus Omnitrophota bacterium]
MIQVYTGNGKGKTTAAFGLALRAAGNGLKVYIAQFVKGKPYGEIKALRKIKNIEVEQFGRTCFIKKSPVSKDILLAKEGLNKVRQILMKGRHDVVILDEINIAIKLGLIPLKDVLGLIDDCSRTELVLTGRYAHPQIVKKADLVSEIKERKHYYRKNIKARKGIEF